MANLYEIDQAILRCIDCMEAYKRDVEDFVE